MIAFFPIVLNREQCLLSFLHDSLSPNPNPEQKCSAAVAAIIDYTSSETHNALWFYLKDLEIKHTALHAGEKQRIT